MYLPLSLTIVAASALWSSYGVLTQDLFVVVPQSVGLLAGLAQLALFIRCAVRLGCLLYLQSCLPYDSFVPDSRLWFVCMFFGVKLLFYIS